MTTTRYADRARTTLDHLRRPHALQPDCEISEKSEISPLALAEWSDTGQSWNCRCGASTVVAVRRCPFCSADAPAGGEGQTQPPGDRARFCHDPRAEDLPNDSGDWARLLASAFSLDGHVADGSCFEALHGLRTFGGRLSRNERGHVVIARGDDISALDYQTYRMTFLLPHKEAITTLLADLAVAQIDRAT